MSWRELMAAASVWAALLMIGVGIALTDPEAIAIGVGLALGAVLLRRGKGVLGRLIVLVLFADVLVFMAPAAVANVANGEGLMAVLPPVALAVVALLGLVATLVSWFAPEGRSGRLVLPGVAVIVVVAVVSQLGVFGDPVDLRAGDEVLKMKAAEFARERIEVDAGPVSIVADNADLFWHTVTIDELDVDVRIPVQARRRVTFDAEPGTYTYYCAVPGHEARMKGKLVVS